jgi:hypothetical protein
VNYPAAYPGVIAVGAIDRTGHLASFSSTRPYVSLTAPGVSLVVATPPDGHATISSTSTASGIVAGVAALVLSRFPHLTVAQVSQALIESTVATASGAGLPPQPARSADGAGYGTVDAIRAVDMAAIITTASQPHQPAPVASHKVARHPVAAPHRAPASALAGSVLRAAVAAVVGLIVLLVIALLVIRLRRERGRARAPDRPRTRGQHENRKPDRGPGPAPDSATANDARAPGQAPAAGPSPSAVAWASPAGWQGGGIGEISPATDTTSRPVVAPLPKSSYRTGRGASRPDASLGPPWAPAQQPRRLFGPLPLTSAGEPPLEPGRGIRVPRDMPAPPGATTEPAPPVSFDLTTPPADFDLSTPAFGLTPPAFDVPLPAFGLTPPASGSGPTASDAAETRTEALPARQDLGFAAAPVLADYEAPSVEQASEDALRRAVAANPSYIWELAATDVFPAATDAAALPDDTPEAGQG